MNKYNLTITQKLNGKISKAKVKSDEERDEFIGAINNSLEEYLVDKAIYDQDPSIYQVISEQEFTFLVKSSLLVEEENIEVVSLIEQEIESLIIEGNENKEVCEKVLLLINGFNKNRNISTEDLTLMMQTFAQAEYALSKNMAKTAKVLIQQIVPDETLVTSQLKQYALHILKDIV